MGLSPKYPDPFMDIGSDGFTVANQLEGIEPVMSTFYFLDISDGTVKQLTEIPHGQAG